MHKTKSRAFTLIELIIVIAIIAILAVTAFLVLTKWMGKSRDSRRVNDISAINSALQIYTSDASLLPLPDSYSGVYDTGYALARYQGNFTDTQASQLSNISKNIKDPQIGYYGYSVTYDRKQYQLMALCENTVSYQNNINNTVHAASQTAKMQGNYAGFLVTATGSIHALWNVPSLFLFTGTAITSGVQYTGGTNNFLQDNKTTDSNYPLAIVDVSNLYNSSTADDTTVYTNIVNVFSGTNNVISQSGATAILQSAAGGITNISIPSQIVCTTNMTQDSYTKLLLRYDNNVTDSSPSAKVVSNSSVAFTGLVNKFGGYSAYFNGSSYMTVADSSDWNFGAGDFTIDLWAKTSYNSIRFFQSPYGGAGNGRNYYGCQISASKAFCYVGIDSTNNVYLYGTSNISDNQWHHIALVRGGNNWYLFVNGIQEDTLNKSFTSSYPAGYNLAVGTERSRSASFKGYIDEFRVSKGIARRTSNFTPPSCPY